MSAQIAAGWRIPFTQLVQQMKSHLQFAACPRVSAHFDRHGANPRPSPVGHDQRRMGKGRAALFRVVASLQKQWPCQKGPSFRPIWGHLRSQRDCRFRGGYKPHEQQTLTIFSSAQVPIKSGCCKPFTHGLKIFHAALQFLVTLAMQWLGIRRPFLTLIARWKAANQKTTPMAWY